MQRLALPDNTEPSRPGSVRDVNLPRRSGGGEQSSLVTGDARVIGIAALTVGIVLVLVFHPAVAGIIRPYPPIAVVAALDVVFGGPRYLDLDPSVAP